MHYRTSPVRQLLAAATGLVVAVLVMIAGAEAVLGSHSAGSGGPSGSSSAESWSRPSPASLSEKAERAQPTPARGQLAPARGQPAQVADPVRVSVPALKIAARMQALHLDKAGRLVPPKYGLAGWYAAGPEPGEIGPAVIAGHLDSKDGADVFAGLGQAREGQRIRVGLEDGKTLSFRVTHVGQFSQANFPTQRVYGDTNRPELRLITCGGDYDHAAGHYLDNVVVFAHLVS
jgi:hypothetical protein